MLEEDLGAHSLTGDDVRTRLRKYDIRLLGYNPHHPHLRRSSVLVPLFFKDGVLNILLTMRSNNLRHHASAAAFPGGAKDDEDADDIITALREAEEEIGLSPSQVEVISVLQPTFARPNYAVYPVVGFIPDDFRPIINKTEVDFVFSVPLARFLRSDFATKDIVLFNRKMTILFFTCNKDSGEVSVWGLTAMFCVMVAAMVFQHNVDPRTYKSVDDVQDVTPEHFVEGVKEVFRHICETTSPNSNL